MINEIQTDAIEVSLIEMIGQRDFLCKSIVSIIERRQEC